MFKFTRSEGSPPATVKGSKPLGPAKRATGGMLYVPGVAAVFYIDWADHQARVESLTTLANPTSLCLSRIPRLRLSQMLAEPDKSESGGASGYTNSEGKNDDPGPLIFPRGPALDDSLIFCTTMCTHFGSPEYAQLRPQGQERKEKMNRTITTRCFLGPLPKPQNAWDVYSGIHP